MKKYAFAVALLVTSFSASAGLYNYIWALDGSGYAGCYPANVLGQVAVGAAAVPNQFCRYSYAWEDYAGSITCLAVGPGGQFLPGAQPVPEANCARAFVFGAGPNGMVECFGQGPDGNIVPGIPPVAPQYCNTP